MDPFDYLVEDCWLHLFQFLTAADKHSLCQTCTSFHALLEPQKTKWAFELILPHILNVREFKHYSRYESSNTVGFSWRLVCKSWKVGFDNYCSSSDYNWAHSRIRNKYNFRNITALEKFLTVFKEHNGNPIIGRRVAIFAACIWEEELISDEDSSENSEEEFEEVEEKANDTEEEEIEESDAAENEIDRDAADNARFERERIERSLQNRELIMELILKYGEEIEHLELSNFGEGDLEIEYCSQLDACRFLHFVLCHTPNLHSLSFYTFDRVGENADSLETELTKYFELNHLPKVPRLRKIQLYGNPPRIDTLLLETYGPNLQTLSPSLLSEISPVVWSNMKCLKELTLFRPQVNYEKLLRALQLPLESLCIEESRETGEKSDRIFVIDKFLLAIQHLPLKKVTVVCPGLNSVKESVPFPATFPQHPTIESLSIQISYPRIISLNFLLFLPKLKSLMLGGNAKLLLDSIRPLLRSRSTTS